MVSQNQAAYRPHSAGDVADMLDMPEADDQKIGVQRIRRHSEQRPENNKKSKGAGGFLLNDVDQVDAEDENFKPLTRQEADVVRRQIQPVSIVRVLAAQVAAGVLVAAASWAVTGRPSAGWSAFYGAWAVIVPAALFARGLLRQKAVPNAGAALMGFFVWELVKVGVTVAMLLVAPRLVPQLSWLALLAGFVVTMKVYWLATWLQLVRTKSVKKI